MHDVELSLGTDFLKASAALPKNQQKKTQEFIEKFRENPDSSGINLEKFMSVDENMRSVRIDREYRGIVLKAPEALYGLAAGMSYEDTWAACRFRIGRWA